LLCGSCTNKTLNKSLEFGAANEESFRFDFLQERPDVAMRFLREDPWQRLQQLRAAVPNVLLQMLLRSSNAVGYTNYADNVVRYFVQQAAQQGVDLFRVFDSLNWVDNMRVAIDAVLETGMLCEGAICYTADIHDRTRKYDLASYLKLARELKAAGVHILGLKDMSGVCRPQAARELVHALRHETGLPVHFHTHDTSGISAASVLAAIEAGCDAVDCALDSMSGLTSQPNLGAIVPALEGGPRDPCAGAQGPGRLERESLATLSDYFEGVRKIYAPFESDIRAGTADVYRHEMPGWQSPVRRCHQGVADLQGGGRHGAVHGGQRPVDGRRDGSRARGGVSGIGGGAFQGRDRLSARRLPGRCVAPHSRMRPAG